MGIPFDSLWWRRLSLGLVLGICLAAVGCEEPAATETSMFESAEVDFRQGNYEDAMEGYQAFLEQYPNSPLASTAEMRLRSIHREVSSVMEATDSPRPTYHGSSPQQRPPPSKSRGDDAESTDSSEP